MKNTKNLVILLLISVCLLPIVGCSQSQDKFGTTKQVIRPVEYQQVKSKDIDSVYTYSGRVNSETSSNLSFRVPGEIEETLVSEGDEVTKGQLLAKLDQSDYQLRVKSLQAKLNRAEAQVRSAKSKVDQAKSGIDSARAQFIEARNNFNRIRKLFQNGNVAKAEYDRARSAKESAKAGLKQAKAKLNEAKEGLESAKAAVESIQEELELAKLKLEYTTLEAPMSGVIVRQYSQIGENVNGGIPIFALDNNDSFEIEVFVNEDFIPQIKRGQKVTVSISAINQKDITGVVAEIGRMASSKKYSGNYPVTIKIADEEIQNLKPGMTAEVHFNTLSNEQELVVPLTAVLSRTDKFVFIIERIDKTYGKVHRIPVKIGELTEKGVEIKEGLKSGQLIVTKGVNRIVDGQKVKLLTKEGGE
ncbi:efflux RND transporter periplasmic adaptor subunit [Sporohalobacter salinus]|uniref:efflux RND transporter periplasmic adaptor subunit n=1 Tax=Sporohalobacter salinus TaxID=1494606 RepID=UPI0019607AC4|nr:efflux RND transporter periplasmic adaptor subunit [Sporohalobacter salinus]MBM7624547.1 multidrug resistance efflux pump [Sporohalobacter salinus]